MIKTVSNHTITKIFEYFGSSYYPEHLRNYSFFRLLLDTGIRISELLSLKLSNININDHSILIKKQKQKLKELYFILKQLQT